MEIVWYGMSCFRMTERGLASVVTDPYDSSIGLPPIKLKADVVTVSHDAPGHSGLASVKAEQRVITGPGEYEIGGVFITGIPMAAQKGQKNGARPNTLYVFDYEGLNVAHLGDLNYVPTQAQIEALGNVHVALVPVGGGGALDATQAAEVISLIEPSVVVPMHYRTGSKGPKLDPLSRFLSEMGVTKTDPLESLKLARSSLPEDTQVVVLEPSS
jgi:L-ascorbate metabolism protein UlaG (beta-lactamase superfamily)